MVRKYLVAITSACIVAVGGSGCRPESSVGKGNAAEIIIGHQVGFQSAILGVPVELKVYLPAGYENSQESYPVVYIFRDYFHLGSGLVQDLVRTRKTPPLVVIDFTNCPFNHFTPTEIPQAPGTGQADDLIRFMEDELIPYVDIHYRTRDFRIIFAQSWGGMFCTYALLTRPETFQAALASSPWLIYDLDQQFILKNAERWLQGSTFSNNFLFFTGGDQPELVPTLQTLAKLFEQSAPEGLIWQFSPMPNADHGALVSKTLYAGLEALFADWNTIPDSVLAQGPTALQRYRTTLASRYGYDIGFSQSPLNQYGWRLKQEGKLEEALQIFHFFVQNYPASPHAYGSLGKTYEDLSEFEKARECYELAIEKAEIYKPENVEIYRTYLKALQRRLSSGE